MRGHLAFHVYCNCGYCYLESSKDYVESLPGVIFALTNTVVNKSKLRTIVRISSL